MHLEFEGIRCPMDNEKGFQGSSLEFCTSHAESLPQNGRKSSVLGCFLAIAWFLQHDNLNLVGSEERSVKWSHANSIARAISRKTFNVVYTFDPETSGETHTSGVSTVSLVSNVLK
jgi:hypothetical protein